MSPATKYSHKAIAQKLIGIAFAVCINVLLFWMVGALFTMGLGVTSGRVLS